MTMRAAEALRRCDVIVGYTVYVELVKEHFANKRFLTTPMKKEIERCRLAFEEANKGYTVAMICSGDAGVYGMSGLMLEIGQACGSGSDPGCDGGKWRGSCAWSTIDPRFRSDQFK